MKWIIWLHQKKNGTANPGAQCTATASLKQAFLIAVSVLSYSASFGLLWVYSLNVSFPLENYQLCKFFAHICLTYLLSSPSIAKSLLLKVIRPRNKTVEPYLLTKNKQTNLFFYPDDSEILKTWILISSFKYFRVIRIEKQIRPVFFWEKLWLDNSFRDLLTFTNTCNLTRIDWQKFGSIQ